MYSFENLARAHGEILTGGCIKSKNEDFVVEEIMPIEPSGVGEHLWVQIRKSGCNTDWLARQLANVAGIKPMGVSYAGLKDRHAITTQWFSLHLPGSADPDLNDLSSDDVTILNCIRHDRKLKRGALAGNHFKLIVRELDCSLEALEHRLAQIKNLGVPNYFGEQRFGHHMDNLVKAEKLFQGELRKVKKHQKGIYLSAARSWIFNQFLSERIKRNNWNDYLSGDVFSLEGKTACFEDDGSTDIRQRLLDADIHPTGPMWGRGESMAKKECLVLEKEIASKYKTLAEGLEQAGLKQERRSLRLMVNNISWRFINESSLLVEFDLPAGAYATMVLREIVDTTAQASK